MAERKHGTGLWGWLGRQFGHVRKAMRADVTKQIVHRQEQVQEAKLPDAPNVTLRRTVIDEVIVDKQLPGKSAEGPSQK
jgi:hypothetical protein